MYILCMNQLLVTNTLSTAKNNGKCTFISDSCNVLFFCYHSTNVPRASEHMYDIRRDTTWPYCQYLQLLSVVVLITDFISFSTFLLKKISNRELSILHKVWYNLLEYINKQYYYHYLNNIYFTIFVSVLKDDLCITWNILCKKLIFLAIPMYLCWHRNYIWRYHCKLWTLMAGIVYSNLFNYWLVPNDTKLIKT